MKTKRITGFVALALFAIAIVLPLGLSGQTNGVGVASLGGGPPAQPVGMQMPAPGMGIPSYMVSEPSVAAYGSPAVAMPQYYGPAANVGFDMTDPTSTQLFGPQVTFDANLAEGLGYTEEYFRLNALVPWHVVPGQTVMLFDIAAATTTDSGGIYSGGIGYRNYDAARDRVFGINAYFDLDQGVQRDDGYQRLSVGFESLGKYLDFRANGYYILGTDEEVLSSELTGVCDFIGHNIVATRERTIETAFSGFDAEVGGPLPFLGNYGINGYAGGYYLDNDTAGDTTGFSGRIEALINDATTANFIYTNDDLLGSNAYASVSVTLPRWRTRGWFKPRVQQERLGDQIRRSNRIHTNVATYRNAEAVVNPLDGRPYELLYVDPNSANNGDGSAEQPFNSLESLAAANAANYDILSVAPRTDNTGTNLTVAGGLDLFSGQQLLGREKTHRIFETDAVICDLPSLTNEDTNGDGFLSPGEDFNGNGVLDSDLDIQAPLISNPVGGPGSYAVSLADNNTVSGFRIDGNGGRGIISRRPLTNFELTCNTIFNHTDAVVLNNVSGTGNFSDNRLDGEDEDGNATSGNGLVLSVAAGERLDLLLENNEVRGHTGDGISLLVRPGARLQANDPNGELGPRTGILNNVANNNGRGIGVEVRDGGTFNGSVEGNEFSENAGDGFYALADGGRVVLRSFAGNTGLNNGANGVFFNYRNDGEFFVISEDRNENGILDDGEDVNGNGLFDLGFIQNNLSGNGENGLCIFGQGSGEGIFDIGGPDATLGNTFSGNLDSGIALDLTGTARAQTDILFNTITSDGSNSPFVSQDQGGLTVVLDFFDPVAQGAFTDSFGFNLTGFDLASFGFDPSESDALQTAILAEVIRDFRDIPTSDVNPLSPIPPGMELAIDFVVGDLGVAPSNGSTEFYTHTISSTDTAAPPLGLAWFTAIRDATGAGPSVDPNNAPNLFANGDHVSSTYSSELPQLGTAFGVTPDDALTSGNLEFTSFAIAGIVSHEVGHNLSLNHVDPGATTLVGTGNAIMGTGATGRPNQEIIQDNQFSIAGTDAERGGATSNNIQQLVDAVGLRVAIPNVGPSGQGVTIRGSDSTRLEPSRILNNSITNLQGDGVSVTMNDSAKAEALDIQGNVVTNNGGIGVRLEANGDNAMIFADQSIGGTGFNTLGGNNFTQSNTISNNLGDGLQVLAANGGMINGNAINNVIENNGGNGIALLIEQYGTIDFGDTSFGENRVVSGNTITGNGGVGILARSDSTPGEITTLKLITEGNTISNNASGGLFADVTGSNNAPPAVPAPLVNSTLDLTIRGETFEGNGDVGVAVSAAGNTKANVLIENSVITGTTDGAQFGGDGISFQRSDSALLTAEVFTNDVSNNFGDGMSTVYSGNNRFDANQPMTGMVNTVTWEGNLFDGNGGNGVSFLGRADAQLIANGTNNTISNNSSNGILVDTREFSTFGDPSDVSFPPPGQRTVFQSNRILNNSLDGINLISSDSSRQLVHITSAASSDAASPHVSGPTDGDTVISGNAEDGVHVVVQDDSDIDVLIDSGDGLTVIENNGTGEDGGNGIRFDASGTSTPTLNVQGVIITGSGAGETEVGDTGLLPDGTTSPDVIAGNLESDTQNGDGIQVNLTQNTQATIQIGGADAGNLIQNNEDDGIAITARGSNATGQPRPTINVQENLVGGLSGGNPAGNGGDGLALNVVGGTFGGPVLGQIRRETGPVITATIENNEFSQNMRIGANFRLTGASGERDRENLGGTGPGGTTLDMNLIAFNNNLVRSNGRDGVFYQANTGYIENRQVNLFGNGAPGAGNGQLPPYSPLHPNLIGLNAGTLNGNSAYQANYLNLRTAQNSLFEALNNEITNNGTELLDDQGTGMTIRVSPNAYVAADVQNTTFGGNLNADFFTESFNVAGNPLNSIDLLNDDDTNPEPFDIIFLDDTAQLDLRFENNIGNQIDVTATGFAYTNSDIGKGILNTNRTASIFQVDRGPFLNNPNNVFSFQGSVQGIGAAFATGGYNLRNAADPLFPNIAFPPALP